MRSKLMAVAGIGAGLAVPFAGFFDNWSIFLVAWGSFRF